MKSEVIEAIRMLAKEKEISEESLFNTIEEALKAAYKKNLPKGEMAPNNLDVTVNRDNGSISVYARKLILEDEEIEDPTNQISLKEAQAINPSYQMGDIAEVDVVVGYAGKIQNAVAQFAPARVVTSNIAQVYHLDKMPLCV